MRFLYERDKSEMRVSVMVDNKTQFPLDSCRDCLKFSDCPIRINLLSLSSRIPEVDISGSDCNSYEEDTSYIPEGWKKYVEDTEPESIHKRLYTMYREFMCYEDDEGLGDLYIDFTITHVPRLQQDLGKYMEDSIEKGYTPVALMMNHTTMQFFTSTKLDKKRLIQLVTNFGEIEVIEADFLDDKIFRLCCMEMEEDEDE